jgi:protein-arginine kinase activator protein McsA
MLSKFRDLILDIKIKFPLKKNQFGYYDAHYTERGHELRCPNCGGALWAIKSYQHIECVTCYKNFSNLGVLGLEEIPSNHWFEN